MGEQEAGQGGSPVGSIRLSPHGRRILMSLGRFTVSSIVVDGRNSAKSLSFVCTETESQQGLSIGYEPSRHLA